MDNKKIPTTLGVIVIIIFSFTIAMFIFKYENIEKQDNIQTSPQNITKEKSPLANQQQELTQKTASAKPSNQDIQEKDCSNHADEKRICKNGALLEKFDGSRCNASTCNEILNGKSVSFRSPFIKKGREIYYEEQYFGNLTKIIDADPATFRPVGSCASMEMSGSSYGKDKNHVYANSKKIEDIDAKSFEYLGSFSNGDGMPYSISISMDKKHVYFACGTLVDFIDRDSFKILGNGYSKDKKRIYYLDHTLDRADRKTFEVIQYKEENGIYGHFALDKNYVFFEGTILKDTNPAICKTQGLAACLPYKWHDLLDPLGAGEKFNDGVY